ncbi:MAG: hypothetical protein WD712_03285 [Candidatus Spechtbacterales bacterium]
MFKEIFESAKEFGVKTKYIVGPINKNNIVRNINNYEDAVFYVSGPSPMVHATEKLLLDTGIKKQSIKTDFFPGYEGI